MTAGGTRLITNSMAPVPIVIATPNAMQATTIRMESTMRCRIVGFRRGRETLTVKAILEMDDRGFTPEVSVFATNPVD